MSKPPFTPSFRQSDHYRTRIKRSVRQYQVYRSFVYGSSSKMTSVQLRSLHYFLDTHIPDEERRTYSPPRAPEGKGRPEVPVFAPRDMLSSLGV